MPRFSQAQLSRLTAGARQIAFSAPREMITDFASRIIPLTAIEQATLLSDPANVDSLANELTEERDQLLANKGRIPQFAVLVEVGRPHEILGLGTALSVRMANPILVSRLQHHVRIRETLRSVSHGSELEAVAAAIIAEACDYGTATRGTGDHGIDAIGWKTFLPILPEIAIRPHKQGLVPPYPWERIMVVASSKAQMAAGDLGLINPAHFRELVGTLVIQQSGAGVWNEHLRPLSPVQLVMVTTYRVSSLARAECRELGLQIWALPELIYLICEFAPNDIFPPNGTGVFDRRRFRRWWRTKDVTRIVP